MAAELRIQLLDGDTVVHQFTRSTSQPCAESISKMIGQALGWLQSYQGAIGDDQWVKDVKRARELQP